MKRVLALLLVTVLVAAACGGGSSGSGAGSGGSSGSMSAADLLKQSQDALKNAKSASFDLTVALKLDGNLQNAGAGAVFLQGPLSLSLKGQAGMADAGSGKFDIHFALNFTGGSFSGEALSPDGKTAYIQMPTLLGPGWKSIDISKETSSTGSSDSSNQSLDQLKALGLNPSKWLKNVDVTSSGDTDTIAADLDVAGIISDMASLSNSPITPKDQKQIDDIVNGIKTAHGSESFDHSTHLPSALSAELALDIPASAQKTADGLQGFDLKVDAAFSDWNSDFTVSAPAGATPLDSGGLFGGALSSAA
ncbi:MAG TPA: hypothetical protein VHI30_07095 [Gaiellales bacterium]|nr:hypothetical protein [Gaiellales bacterium]